MSETKSLLERGYQAEIDGINDIFEKSKQGFINQLKETPYTETILQYPNIKIRDIIAGKFREEKIIVTIHEDENKNRISQEGYGFWASLP